MLPDLLTINVGANEYYPNAISRGMDSSVYRTDDGNYTVTVSRRFLTERHRFTVRFDQSKIAADPLVSANNRVYTQSAYLVVDRPTVGYTLVESANLAKAIGTFLLHGTPDNIDKMLTGQT